MNNQNHTVRWFEKTVGADIVYQLKADDTLSAFVYAQATPVPPTAPAVRPRYEWQAFDKSEPSHTITGTGRWLEEAQAFAYSAAMKLNLGVTTPFIDDADKEAQYAALGRAVLEAGSAYHQQYNREHPHTPVVWIQSLNGTLVIIATGEFREQLLGNISAKPLGLINEKSEHERTA